MTKVNTAPPDIDPTFKALLDAVPMTFRAADGIEVARAMVKQVQAPPETLPDLRIDDRTIGYAGLSGVGVRIYWPPAGPSEKAIDKGLPIVVFYHGGGRSVGDLDTHDALVRAHCVGADAIVVSVDYRLAPEHPFPAAIDDSWAALRWVGEHATELGGDPNRIAVAGDSAGGNIAAVMAQLSRDNADKGGPPLAFQLLWYPCTTADPSLPSLTENADAPFLDRDAIDSFTTWYASGVDMSDHTRLPATLAPANAADLSDLPPAFIGTAGYDPLRDDGAQYAELLKTAGVPVELCDEPTLVHGYASFALVVPAAAEATNRGLAALKKALRSLSDAASKPLRQAYFVA